MPLAFFSLPILDLWFCNVVKSLHDLQVVVVKHQWFLDFPVLAASVFGGCKMPNIRENCSLKIPNRFLRRNIFWGGEFFLAVNVDASKIQSTLTIISSSTGWRFLIERLPRLKITKKSAATNRDDQNHLVSVNCPVFIWWVGKRQSWFLLGR